MNPLWKPAVLAGALLSAVLCSPLTWAKQAGPLEVSLDVPTVQLHLTDTMVAQVAMNNTDAHRRVVLRGEPGFSAGGGLTLMITDSSGTTRSAPAMPGELSLSDAQSGARHVVLEPGHGMGMHRRDAVSALFPSAGRYQLQVIYRSPMPTADNPSANAGDLEGTETVSNVVAIDVIN